MADESTNNVYRISDESMLRSLFSEVNPLAAKKSLAALDHHCENFIARAPFLCLSTQHANGTADVSPRGDPPGFVRVLDQHTITIPDRPGNNRLDSLSNIISNPSVGILLMILGFEDTLRINGQAYLDRNPELLATMLVNGRTPTLAIVVEVEEAFFHCAKALRRAKLWQAESLQERRQMPSLAAMVREQIDGKPVNPTDLSEMERDLENEYANTMY